MCRYISTYCSGCTRCVKNRLALCNRGVRGIVCTDRNVTIDKTVSMYVLPDAGDNTSVDITSIVRHSERPTTCSDCLAEEETKKNKKKTKHRRRSGIISWFM